MIYLFYFMCMIAIILFIVITAFIVLSKKSQDCDSISFCKISLLILVECILILISIDVGVQCRFYYEKYDSIYSVSLMNLGSSSDKAYAFHYASSKEEHYIVLSEQGKSYVLDDSDMVLIDRDDCVLVVEKYQLSSFLRFIYRDSVDENGCLSYYRLIIPKNTIVETEI